MKFSKMHGLGNDFVVIDAITQPVLMRPALARHLADRRRGVGCDQVLLAESPQRSDAHARYRIFNADGSEVEHCGNGVRCLALFLHRQGLCSNSRMVIEVGGRTASVCLLDNGHVEVDMGPPMLEPSEVPLDVDAVTIQPGQASYLLSLQDRSVVMTALSMGNPHAIIRVSDLDQAPVDILGSLIETHPAFPDRVNVGFMEIADRSRIRLRVFERGCGETQACGTGACAAVVAGRLRGWLDDHVDVALTGGHLQISWQGGDQSVHMTGPAVHVFDGVWPSEQTRSQGVGRDQ